MTNFAVTPAWTSAGFDATSHTSTKEAMVDNGLDFEVETVPSLHTIEQLTAEDVENMLLDIRPKNAEDYLELIRAANSRQYENASGHMLIRRTDTKAIFGRCGNHWEPLQNVDAFDWFQPALDAGLVKLDKIGTLNGGAKLWILAEIQEDPIEVVPGDEIRKYTILTNGHDGKTAIGVGFTPIRVWCANMFPQLRRNAATNIIRMRHTSRAKVNLDTLRDMMNYANREFEATVEQYRVLTRTDFKQADVEKYVKILLCKKDEVEKPLKDLSTRKANQIRHIMELFEGGYGLKHQGVRGTAYAAFNAYNQYINHEAGRNVDNRLNSLWFGQNANANQRALDLALELAA